MTTPPPPWEAWAPPLDPPTAGGLPYDQAEAIASDWWDLDPHLCAALQWESYAAMLPPVPPVSSVQTGVQSVAYSPASPPGELGAAMARAEWHRSLSTTGSLDTVPLVAADATWVDHSGTADWWPGWWPPVLGDP